MNKSISVQIFSFLGLLCVFTGSYLVLTVLDFFTLTPISRPALQYPAGIIGAVLGMVISPLFLPFRKKDNVVADGILAVKFKVKKPALISILFLLLITAAQFIIRSMGVEYWIKTPLAVLVMGICTGSFYPISHGVFLLSAKKHSAFFLAIAICAAVIARHFSTSLLVTYAADPFTAMNGLFAATKWLLTIAGICFAVCIIQMKKENPTNEKPVTCSSSSLIFRLIGLAVIFNVINAALEMSLFPVMTGNTPKHGSLFIFTVVVGVLFCAFFAGRAIDRFLRVFLGSAIVLFILLPCLVLFSEYSGFVILLSYLAAVFRFTVWAVFTVVIIQNYTGGVWFYAAAASIYMTQFFSFLGPLINRFIPHTTESTIVLMLVTAAAFVFFAMRFIYPKTPQPVPLALEPPQITALADIFSKRELSKREAEVAELMVKEGIEAKAIGERLFISTTTAKSHILSIYRKFDVSKRGEFMAVVVNALANV